MQRDRERETEKGEVKIHPFLEWSLKEHFPPETAEFSKSSKCPYFYSVSPTVGGGHFLFKKGQSYKERTLLEGQKTKFLRKKKWNKEGHVRVVVLVVDCCWPFVATSPDPCKPCCCSNQTKKTKKNKTTRTTVVFVVLLLELFSCFCHCEVVLPATSPDPVNPPKKTKKETKKQKPCFPNKKKKQK